MLCHIIIYHSLCYIYAAKRLTLFPCRSKLISDKSPVPIFCVFRAVLATKIDLQVAIFSPSARITVNMFRRSHKSDVSGDPKAHLIFVPKPHLIFVTKHHNRDWCFSSASMITCTLHICINCKHRKNCECCPGHSSVSVPVSVSQKSLKSLSKISQKSLTSLSKVSTSVY